MRSRQPLPASLLLLVLVLAPTISPLTSMSVDAAQVNATVDDTSPSIAYSPTSSWHASSASATACVSCLTLNASIAFDGTWHNGVHIIKTADADDGSGDVPSSSSSSAPQPTASNSNGNLDDASGHDDDDGDSSTDKKGDKDKDKRSFTHRHMRQRRASPSENPFFTTGDDEDDPGFVDTPVTVEFNFTGSAVYVFALLPLGVAAVNTTPTHMNLTYVLDDQPAGSFIHNGTSSASGFLPSFAVFSSSGLGEGPHSLQVQVGPDSVFLLDYIEYSHEDAESGNSSSATSSASGVQESGTSTQGSGSTSPSPNPAGSNLSTSTSSKSHSIATFAGAVGGSIGLLSVLALSLAISIYRRRLAARRRDRRIREEQGYAESFHTDASDDGPPMSGPAPFVPRYFPGTMPTAPPPYVAAFSPANDATALLSSTSPLMSPLQLWPPGRNAEGESDSASYADRPPPTPPPIVMEDGTYFPPPPSFPVAISTPIPAILAGYSAILSNTIPSATPPPPEPSTTRSRANSETRSYESRGSDLPPSFHSQAPHPISPPRGGPYAASTISSHESRRHSYDNIDGI
ncbi:hypothetical protein CERSUDRAFT_116666 [Gelatoporia subvermispora B]|uniref:Uncharacterized protein n=1 Tax=Ceriporiopsis subvermispora (strain B) TaxID=914234 RepID=M2R8Y0_CERS8|nr:hypothetical protein CERSUDRAFT_116666 [Gelatoporia subvermispora B]